MFCFTFLLYLVNQVVQEINESKRSLDNNSRLLYLNRKIDWCDFHFMELITPSRRLFYELKDIKVHKKDIKDKNNSHLLLFNDVLILYQRGVMKYNVKKVIPITGISKIIQNTENLTHSVQYTIQVVKKKEIGQINVRPNEYIEYVGKNLTLKKHKTLVFEISVESCKNSWSQYISLFNFSVEKVPEEFSEDSDDEDEDNTSDGKSVLNLSNPNVLHFQLPNHSNTLRPLSPAKTSNPIPIQRRTSSPESTEKIPQNTDVKTNSNPIPKLVTSPPEKVLPNPVPSRFLKNNHRASKGKSLDTKNFSPNVEDKNKDLLNLDLVGRNSPRESYKNGNSLDSPRSALKKPVPKIPVFPIKHPPNKFDNHNNFEEPNKVFAKAIKKLAKN